MHASQWARFPAQTTLMREGDKAAELLFLASGEVKVVKLGRLLNTVVDRLAFADERIAHA